MIDPATAARSTTRPPESAAPAVALVGLSKHFGAVRAVDGVDLSIRDGEFFSMLGPSGSGKTTVLRLIAGFESPTAGTVRLGGVDVTDKPPFERDVNTVFQDYALFPHMSVEQNVAYGLMVKGVGRVERRERSRAALSTVRLAGYEDRRPAQLSGGQRQRVALARALVNRPRVLLLDEPLGALDLKLREEMQVELKAIQREVGITFVFVTHDQDEALSMSDRIAVFNAGRIEQVGTPADVYEHPVSAFVAGFVGTSNLITGELARAVIGMDGVFLVRPEKIRLGRPAERPGPDEVGALGRVAEVVYVGAATRLVVDLAPPAAQDSGDAGSAGVARPGSAGSPAVRLTVLRQNQEMSSMDALALRDSEVRLIWRKDHNFPVALARD